MIYIATHPNGEWATFSFESARAREAFINGWCYALAGDDPAQFAYEEHQFTLTEVTLASSDAGAESDRDASR